MTPEVVQRPILFPFSSVNQRAPSGPTVMPHGAQAAVGTLYSVTAPEVVILPILLPLNSVNQRLPSGPVTMYEGCEAGWGRGYSFVMAPLVVQRPILLPYYSVNQRAPSGPNAMPNEPLPAVGTGISAMETAARACSGTNAKLITTRHAERRSDTILTVL